MVVTLLLDITWQCPFARAQALLYQTEVKEHSLSQTTGISQTPVYRDLQLMLLIATENDQSCFTKSMDKYKLTSTDTPA